MLSRRGLIQAAAGGSLAAAAQQSTDATAVVARQTGRELELSNGHIKAVFTTTPDGIEQQYFAKSATGWTPVAESFRPPSPRPAGTSPLFSDSGVSSEHRILAGDALRTVSILVNTADVSVVVLDGMAGGTTVTQRVELRRGQQYFHVDISAQIAGSTPLLEYLLSAFVFAGVSPEFAHAPCMKRAPDDVIGDRVFHSPAVVLQKGPLFAALVPDLETANAEIVYAKGARPIDGPRSFRLPVDSDKASMPTALDLDMQSGVTRRPVFSYGIVDFVTEQHVYWRHENKNGSMVRDLSSDHVRFGFDLLLSASAPTNRGYARASEHLWRRYGRSYSRKPKPQALPFAEYAKVCYPAAFAYRGDTADDTKRYSERKPYDPERSGTLPTWLEFDLDGKPVGGIRATPAQWYNDIQFMAWWNNVHLALGMYFWGKRLRDDSLLAKCRRIIDLALAAPQTSGIFPAVYNYKDKRWVGCYWKPAPPYDPAVLPKYWDFNSDYYQTASASKTAALLLRYSRLCENDERILPFARKYADFILGHLDSNGCLPAWFTVSLDPVRHLRFNAEGGVHLWFLSELYHVTKEKKYLDGAERIAEFLTREVLPQQRWYDFETFYSCASKPEATFDARTGQWPRCTLSMIWAIEGFTSLYEATRKPQHLESAQAVADYTAFYQTVWQPHFIITAYAFGGCISQNSDAEWLDMRQCLLGEAFVRLGVVCGRQDLMERGVAAVRSAFSVINHPAHIANGIFPTPSYPLGITAENIDHEGLPQLPLRSGSDWGEGGALASAAQVMSLVGGAHIDFKRNLAVGVDGVTMDQFRVSGREIAVELRNLLRALPVPYEAHYPIALTLTGVTPGRYSLTVNGGAPIPVDCPGRVQIDVGA